MANKEEGFDEYLAWESNDGKDQEWFSHSQPNAQGLYDIGWYANRITPPQLAKIGGTGLYTSGTLQQALTGNYNQYRPNMSLSDSRPIGHGKMWGNESPTVRAARDALVSAASRGVGQPSIDGMIDAAVKRNVLASFIKNNILSSR